MIESHDGIPAAFADDDCHPKPDSSPVVAALDTTPLVTEDPARAVGDLFRRLTLANEAYPGEAFARIVRAVLVALGRASMVEAERQALWLRERAEPARPGTRVSATARRVDFDAWDPGDPD